MAFRLVSPAFGEGARIPSRHTCEGADLSPALEWSDAPKGTLSFALVCSDPDAPAGTWYHWAAFDIAPDAARLEEGFPTDAKVGAVRQAQSDFRRTGYGGPCPPKGHGVHHYHFDLMALDVEHLAVPSPAGCRDVEKAAKGHVLAEATLTGTYSR